MKLIDKLAYKTLKKVLNLREEFKTTQEIEEYQLSKLKKKLKHAYKKSNYWHEKITQWSQEYNKTPKEFIKEIKSTKDYTKKIPVTTREEISKHGREMTTKSLDKLIETQTSVTSTNKSLKI